MILVTNSTAIIDIVNERVNENNDASDGDKKVHVVSKDSTDTEYEHALRYNLADVRELSVDKPTFDGHVMRHIKLLASMNCKQVETTINEAERNGHINILRYTSIGRVITRAELGVRLEHLMISLRDMLGPDVHVSAIKAISEVINAKYSTEENTLNHHEFTFLDSSNGVLKYFSCCIRCSGNAFLGGITSLFLGNASKIHLDTYGAVFTINNTNFIDFIETVERQRGRKYGLFTNVAKGQKVTA